MRVYYGSRAAKGKLWRPIITLGVFDGVHRGHQHIFKQCLREAKRQRGTAVVYTFDPHPVSVLFPGASPPLINTLPQKLELLAASGFRAAVVETFTPSFSQLAPEAFFKKILMGRLRARSLFVGYDFTFGVHRTGTTERLKALGKQYGVAVNVIAAFLLKEYLVSSTEIRKRIEVGDMVTAAELLGHPYFIDGKIVRGEGRGAQIGIPTANLSTDNRLLPPTGVYATYSRLQHKRYRGVTNIGTRPTFGGTDATIETHLIAFRRPILGRRVRLEFLTRLRDEQKFTGPEDLVAEIRHDIQVAQRFFRQRPL